MWTTESLWFEIAIVSIIFALGNILMGHFEEQTPKIRRVGKYFFNTVNCLHPIRFFGKRHRYGISGKFHYTRDHHPWLLFAQEKKV